MTISCQLHRSAASPWACGINTTITQQTLRRTKKSAPAGNQSTPQLHNPCSLSSNQGVSPQMKPEWFSTITAIAISKKEVFTGSFIAMELLELCRPLTKERNNGLGSQVPPPQQDRDIAQCRLAILCIYCEHSVLWFKRRDKFLLPVLIWQITYFTLVNSSKYLCDCTNKWITPFMSLKPVLQACFTNSININDAIFLEWSPILEPTASQQCHYQPLPLLMPEGSWTLVVISVDVGLQQPCH